jgi:hypoxanthine phosphoribosyltransferase
VTAAADLERVYREAQQLYSPSEVAAALDSMAARISADLAHRNPLVVAVMHGGIFAAVNLCSRFQFLYEFDYVHVGRYGRNLDGGELEWIVRPGKSCRNRVVLLVDDVLDKGLTLTALQAAMHEASVAELRTAVLVSKDTDNPGSRPPVDYVGLSAGREYLFGCGMDYRGYWRHSAGLFAVQP